MHVQIFCALQKTMQSTIYKEKSRQCPQLHCTDAIFITIIWQMFNTLHTQTEAAIYLNLSSITMLQVFLNNWLDSIIKLVISEHRFHLLQLVCILFNQILLSRKDKYAIHHHINFISTQPINQLLSTIMIFSLPPSPLSLFLSILTAIFQVNLS